MNIWTPSRLALALGCLALPSAAIADDSPTSERASAILEAMELPEVTHKLRTSGMDNAEIKGALDALQKDKPPAERGQPNRASRNARAVLGAEAESADELGPMNGFGTFVRTQVEGGVRGTALRDAIRSGRAEHPRTDKATGLRRGQGKAEGAKDRGQGKAEGAEDRGQGKAEGAKDRGQGKAEGAKDRGQGKAEGAKDAAEEARAKARQKAEDAKDAKDRVPPVRGPNRP